MTRRAPFLALGTGRCGSTSLATILNNCQNTEVTHEVWRGARWDNPEDPELEKMVEHFNHVAEQGVLVGDVQQCLWPHVKYLRERIPDLKIIILHRDRESTIGSFLGFQHVSFFTPGGKAIHRNYGCPLNKIAVDWFPTFETEDREEAFGLWWDLCTKMAEEISEPVFQWNIQDLNNDEKLEKLMDWLEIPVEDRNVPEQRKYLWERKPEDQ